MPPTVSRARLDPDDRTARLPQVLVPERLLERAQVAAARQGITFSAWLRGVIERALDALERLAS